jgi:small subunit ribosomal protein S6
MAGRKTSRSKARREAKGYLNRIIFHAVCAEQTLTWCEPESSQKEKHMNRVYEVMFIVRPDATEEDLDKLIEGFSANVTAGNGEVQSVEKLGRRRLAYTVRKFNDGIYVLLTIGADGKLIAEVERRLRVTESVIKFITVRMDEEQKRLAKKKALRDSKVKRSAQPTFAPAAVPAPAVEAVASAEVATPAAVPAEAVPAEAAAPAAV